MTPTPQAIAEAAGVTSAYARMLLTGARRPSLGTALRIYDATGWRAGPLTGLTAQDIDAARKVAA